MGETAEIFGFNFVFRDALSSVYEISMFPPLEYGAACFKIEQVKVKGRPLCFSFQMYLDCSVSFL
jgi:hypothetical protein